MRGPQRVWWWDHHGDGPAQTKSGLRLGLLSRRVMLCSMAPPPRQLPVAIPLVQKVCPKCDLRTMSKDRA